MKKRRWAVSRKDGFKTFYWSPYGDSNYQWTRRLKRIAWWNDKPSAQRSFNHSMWVVVPEEEVLADLVAEAVTLTDEAL